MLLRRRCARAAAHAPPPRRHRHQPTAPDTRREFGRIATIKKDNLKLPILLRECSGVQARLVAVYGAPAPAKFARVRPPPRRPRAAPAAPYKEKSIAIDGMNDAEFGNVLAETMGGA